MILDNDPNVVRRVRGSGEPAGVDWLEADACEASRLSAHAGIEIRPGQCEVDVDRNRLRQRGDRIRGGDQNEVCQSKTHRSLVR